MVRNVKPEIKKLIQECLARPGTGEAFVEQAKQSFRQRCKDDPFFLLYHVLGYRDLDDPLHRDMIERWRKRRDRLYSLWQVPRGHLKTSVWTIGMSIWELLLDPNIRILIINAVFDNAQGMMAAIKTHFETNEVFRWLFPEYCLDLAPASRKKRLCKQTIDRIDVPCGDRMGRQEGNVECLGVEMSLVSKHFDLFMYDDLVNDLNTATKNYRDKVWKWFLNSWQLRHSPTESRLRLIGTPWHLDDVQQRVVRGEHKHRKKKDADDKLLKPKWLIYRRAAIEELELPDGSKVMEPIWPERYPLHVLEELRDGETGVGSYIFSCQYLCNPMSPEDALFKLGDIKLIHEDDLPDDMLNFAAVDLAEEGDDFTVIVVASFDSHGKMYVRHIVRGQIRPLELIDTVRTLNEIWHLNRIGIETVGFQKTIYKFYKDYGSEKGFYLPWVEMKRGNIHKIRRFLALQPLVERGYFHVVDGIANQDQLISEMTTVSVDHLPTHDDILDCLADIQQVFYAAPKQIIEDRPPPGSIDALFGSLDEDAPDSYLESSVIGRSYWRTG